MTSVSNATTTATPTITSITPATTTATDDITTTTSPPTTITKQPSTSTTKDPEVTTPFKQVDEVEKTTSITESQQREERTTTPPPSTERSGGTKVQQQQVTATKVRRSSRSLHNRTDPDPIIAPGFGTAKDIHRLSVQLSEGNEIALPSEAIIAMMNSRGQGTRRSSRGGDDVAAATTSSSAQQPTSAWAEFMKEEGVDDKKATSTNNDMSSPASRKRSQQQEEMDNGKKKKSTVAAEEEEDDLQQQHCGVLVQTGTLDTTIVGRNKVKIDNPPTYNLFEPTILLNQKISIRSVHTSSNSCHSIAISKQGVVYGWGRNEYNQLSSFLPDDVVLPTILSDIPHANTVISAATGKSHTLFLMEDGSVYGIGFNKSGQCGVKANADTITTYRKCIFQQDGEVTTDIRIKQVACGEDFSMAVSVEGYLFSAGSSEYGKLGNGETGEHIVTAGKTSFANCNVFVRRKTFCHAPNEKLYSSGGNTKEKVVPLDDSETIMIDQVACGKHHTIAIEMMTSNIDATTDGPRVFSWGCGAYGCLGHGVQVDEYYPRMIGALVNVTKMTITKPGSSTTPAMKSVMSVSAGAGCSLLQLPNGHVYYWGKHRTIGEATMRPNLVDALANNGHVVRHVDAGAQGVVFSTSNAVTVAWGQGTYGELGFGIAVKSSAKPNFVPALDGCRIASMACGYGHTLFVVRNDDDEDKTAVKKITVLNHDDCQPLIDAAAAKTSKRDK